MQRGEVWWANLAPPIGRRPVMLLSRNAVYPVRASVTVAVVTQTIRGIATEVPLDERDGMPARCVVNLDDILTVRKAALLQPITTLTRDKLDQVRRAIAFALDLSHEASNGDR